MDIPITKLIAFLDERRAALLCEINETTNVDTRLANHHTLLELLRILNFIAQHVSGATAENQNSGANSGAKTRGTAIGSIHKPGFACVSTDAALSSVKQERDRYRVAMEKIAEECIREDGGSMSVVATWADRTLRENGVVPPSDRKTSGANFSGDKKNNGRSHNNGIQK